MGSGLVLFDLSIKIIIASVTGGNNLNVPEIKTISENKMKAGIPL